MSLGVRVPTDIVPDADGMVHPMTGGMSVTPSRNDLGRLPPHMIPRRLSETLPGVFGHARGPNRLAVYAMGNGPFRAEPIAAGLDLRLDPRQAGHGYVEPDRVTALANYRAALGATREFWSVEDEP